MNEERDPKLGLPSRLRTLWLGEAPLRIVFWWHAMAVGTLLNVLATLLFVFLQSLEMPDAVGLAAFFLPVPYNIFIAIAVWRSAGRYAGPLPVAHMARVAVSLWAVTASIV